MIFIPRFVVTSLVKHGAAARGSVCGAAAVGWQRHGARAAFSREVKQRAEREFSLL